MIKQILNYEQIFKNGRENGEAPRDYYDPHIMLAESHFKIEPEETVLIAINGNGYQYNDDTVYSLKINDNNFQVNNINNFNPSLGIASLLCLIIKNCSPDFSIYIGCKTSLQWLLDMPRINSKLCYCSIADLSQFRVNLPFNHNEEIEENVPMFNSATDNTIVIK